MGRILFILLACIGLSGCVSPSVVMTMQDDLDKLKSQNTELTGRVVQIEAKLLEISSTPTPLPTSGISVEPTIGSLDLLQATPTARPEPVDVEHLYSKAQGLLQEKSYREAIIRLEQAAALTDSTEMKAKCLYWIGECYYAQSAFQRALEFFSMVVKDYPAEPKAPDALLKLGFTYYELQEYDKCMQVLEEFIEEYPSHSRVDLAKERVQSVKDLQLQKSKADSTSSKKESRR